MLSTVVHPLVKAVDRFFEDVLADAEGPTTRSERLGLLVSADRSATAHTELGCSALPKDLRAA